jgi:hypothetical protein
MSTLGGLYSSTAFPQSGTTNKPFSIGPVPAFSPVVTTITSDHATLILNQAAIVSALLKNIHASLNEINKNIIEIDKFEKDLPKLISNLEPVLAAWANSISISSIPIAALASNEIRTNNFITAVKGETPDLPTLQEQFSETLTDAVTFTSSTGIATVVQEQTTKTANTVVSWIGSTDTYKTIGKWIGNLKDTILSAILPDTPADVASKASSFTGIPKP